MWASRRAQGVHQRKSLSSTTIFTIPRAAPEEGRKDSQLQLVEGATHDPTRRRWRQNPNWSYRRPHRSWFGFGGQQIEIRSQLKRPRTTLTTECLFLLPTLGP